MHWKFLPSVTEHLLKWSKDVHTCLFLTVCQAITVVMMGGSVQKIIV